MTFELPAPLRRFRRRVLWHTRWGDLTGGLLFDLGYIIAGTLCMALSVDIFLDPNNVVPGGFTALAMFANRLWGWPVGATLFGLNLPFLLLGMRVLGVQFGPKTLLTNALVAVFIDALQPYLPTVTGEPLLYILYGGLLYGLGMGLVFRANATSGGTEIPAKLLEHFRGMRMANSLLAMDILILTLAAFFFGLAPALYALISAWVMARIIDALETGFNAGNVAHIITARPDLVRDGILEQLERGVTILRGEGGYTGAERVLLFTAIQRRQVPALQEIVRQADPDAFLVVTASHEVLGEGFKPLTRTRRS